MNRLDDNVDSIRERFRQYEENTKPLLRYYAKHHLHRIKAAGSPEEVFRRTMTSLISGRSVPQIPAANRRSVLLASSAVG
jgi:hypothetical protein